MANSAAYIDFDEAAAPATPAAGKVRQYAKTDGSLYQKDDAGTETGLAGGGGGVGDTTIVRKSADETVNNSAALQNDNHLLLALAASEVWHFELALWFSSGATPDLKLAFTVPAGATVRWYTPDGRNASAVEFGNSTVSGSGTTRDFEGAGAGTVRGLQIIGHVVCGATPGDLQLQWAQNTANASDTVIYANSLLRATQLA